MEKSDLIPIVIKCESHHESFCFVFFFFVFFKSIKCPFRNTLFIFVAIKFLLKVCKSIFVPWKILKKWEKKELSFKKLYIKAKSWNWCQTYSKSTCVSFKSMVQIVNFVKWERERQCYITYQHLTWSITKLRECSISSI